MSSLTSDVNNECYIFNQGMLLRLHVHFPACQVHTLCITGLAALSDIIKHNGCCEKEGLELCYASQYQFRIEHIYYNSSISTVKR